MARARVAAGSTRLEKAASEQAKMNGYFQKCGPKWKNSKLIQRSAETNEGNQHVGTRRRPTVKGMDGIQVSKCIPCSVNSLELLLAPDG